MSIPPGGIIPMEVHKKSAQFFRVESGLGIATIGGKSIGLSDGDAFIVPPNTRHEVEAIGNKPLKLYTIYTHPEHPQGTKEKKMPVGD
jgi:mannose-6-phosphate isomerase-like protein (cupin superfamily)